MVMVLLCGGKRKEREWKITVWLTELLDSGQCLACALKPQMWALLSNILDGSARWCFFIPSPQYHKKKQGGKTKSGSVLRNSSKAPSLRRTPISCSLCFSLSLPLWLFCFTVTFWLQTSTTLLTVFLNGIRHRWQWCLCQQTPAFTEEFHYVAAEVKQISTTEIIEFTLWFFLSTLVLAVLFQRSKSWFCY